MGCCESSHTTDNQIKISLVSQASVRESIKSAVDLDVSRTPSDRVNNPKEDVKEWGKKLLDKVTQVRERKAGRVSPLHK